MFHVSYPTLRKRRGGVCKSSCRQIRNQRSFIQTILWTKFVFVKTCVGIRTSQLHTTETDGIAESAIRRVKEGTSALLVQSGLSENRGKKRWNSFCLFLESCKTNWPTESHRMHEDSAVPFDEPILPYGAAIYFNPISSKGDSRLHQFDAKILPGILFGHALKF